MDSKIHLKIIQGPDCVNWDYEIKINDMSSNQRREWNNFLRESSFLERPNGSQYTEPGFKANFNITYYVLTLHNGKNQHQIIVTDPGCNQKLTNQIKTMAHAVFAKPMPKMSAVSEDYGNFAGIF